MKNLFWISLEFFYLKKGKVWTDSGCLQQCLFWNKIPKISVMDPYIFLSDPDLRLRIRPDLNPDFCQDIFVALEKKCSEIGTTSSKSLNINNCN